MAWIDLPLTDELEDIDDPAQPYTEMARAMGDVARANSLYWGTRPIISHVAALLRDVPQGTTIRILDIATGSADIPDALQRWGRKRGLSLEVVGLDNMPAMLRMAQECHPTVPTVQADALHMPFAPGAFDIVLCALAFHHFGFDDSVSVLRAMDRLSKRGFIVSDLRRDRLTLWTVQTGMRLLCPHPFTKHDAPTSVRRSFTPREYAKMVALSGAQDVRIHSHGYVRIALVQQKRKKSAIGVQTT
jgi:ubiquinone/menaquinone biosynthesis C-methylase UbiE